MYKIKVTEVFKLVISIVVCQFAAFIGSFFTRLSISDWYATLAKPPLTPPAWVFAPVWITLFFMMGVSSFLVWREGLNDDQIKTALGMFVVQLILNVLWPVVFFGLRSPLAGLIDIAMLWFAIVLTISHFSRISRMAAVLLIPYVVWVSYAATLNFSIWRLNT